MLHNTYRAAQLVITPPGMASRSAASARLRTGDRGTVGRVPRAAEVTATQHYGDLPNDGHEPINPSRAAIQQSACPFRDRTLIRVRGLGILRSRGPLTRDPRR
jgi:hypothetical protein